MRAVSAGFLRAVRSTHNMVARARVCTTYQTSTDPAGTFIDILAGDVEMSATADIRSTLSLTTNGFRSWPGAAADLLAPYGNEIFVERGIMVNGEPEYVHYGFFQIREVEQDTPPDGPITIAASDRMAGIVDSRLLVPRQFVPTDTYGDCIRSLAEEVYPDVVIEWDDATDVEPIGRAVIAEDDRYGAMLDIVKSRGKIMYFNDRGALAIKDLPSTTDPVFEVDAGPGGVLVSLNRKISRVGAYNAVVASGEAPDEADPVRAIAVDGNPASATYFFGRFGKIPIYYTSPLLTTEDAAEKAAETILAKRVGLPYTVEFKAVPNAALEVFDAVRITPSVGATPEIHVLDTISVGLTADQDMPTTTREQGVEP